MPDVKEPDSIDSEISRLMREDDERDDEEALVLILTALEDE